MSDWKWIAPVSVQRQHICGLICLLLRKPEPWAVSSQWPHSRQNSGTVMLHVTGTPSFQETALKSVWQFNIGFSKSHISGRMYRHWSLDLRIWLINILTCFNDFWHHHGRTIKSTGPWGVSVELLRIRSNQGNQTSSSTRKCRVLHFIFCFLKPSH